MIKIFNKSELPWETTEYLDIVLKFLCEDTKMCGCVWLVSTPIWDRSTTLFADEHDEKDYQFFYDYCRKIYGLLDDEIKYVWRQYVDYVCLLQYM